MSSLVITVKSPDTATTLRSQLVKQTGAGAHQAAILSKYFHSIAGGVKSASFEVNTASAHPVKATGTLTLTYASIVDNNTMTIGKTTLTWKTTAPANENEVRKITDLATTAANLVTAINAHSVLGNILTATNVAGVVTVTCKSAGEIGNQIALSSSNGTGTAVSGAYMAGGTGGPTGTAASFARGY